ncbi:hypothetical protein DIURU_003713 [Diutina rugosa]|uniref:Uncharacterized protein n=1 Tax=Diutina rugosa TaxID=5481 RepID=A0A642UJY8_DIURU|nr:uncharacterized protein DIURU_003713 [Diutina rugosa]KAA8900601.1 hypothetical protein DIURU_003713 [Diutina rugosa]
MSDSEHSSQSIPEASANSPSPTELCKLVVDSPKFQEEMAKLANEIERQQLIRVVKDNFECEEDLANMYPCPKDANIVDNLSSLLLAISMLPGIGADDGQKLSRGIAEVTQIAEFTQKKLDNTLTAVPDAPSEEDRLQSAYEATELVRAKGKEGFHNTKELCHSLRGLNRQQVEVIDEMLAGYEQRMEEYFEKLHARCLVLDIPRSIIEKAESLVVEVLAAGLLQEVSDSELVDEPDSST